MTRYLDTFFRHPWVYLGLLALVLGGSALAADRALSRVAPYTAEATFAANLDPTRGRDIGTRPPAEQYAELLGELMATDTFVINALSKATRLSGELDSEESAAAIAKQVRKNWKQHAAGPNTVRVSYSCDEPELCAEVANAIIAQYAEEISATGSRLSGAVMTFYREQLALAEQRLRTLSPTDPSRDQARATYDALLRRITEVELTDQLEEQTRRASFRVLAPATPPLARASSVRAAIAPVAAGTLVGVALVLALVMVMTWTDSTIRSPEQVMEHTGLSVALITPHARRRRLRPQRTGRSPAGSATALPVHAGASLDRESRSV